MMKFEALLKHIKENDWWTEEAPAVLQLCIPFMKAFEKVGPFFGLKPWTVSLLVVKNGIISEKTCVKEKTKMFYVFLRKYNNDKSFFKKKVKQWELLKKVLMEKCLFIENCDLKSQNNKQLWNLYEDLIDSIIKEFTPPISAECCDMYTDKLIVEDFTRLTGLSQQASSKKLLILTSPAKHSFIETERLSFLKLCLLFLKSKGGKSASDKFNKELEKHANSFFWVRNNFKDTHRITENEFLELVKEEVKKRVKNDITNELKNLRSVKNRIKIQKKNLFSQLHLPGYYKRILKFISFMAGWQDERKKIVLIANHYQNELLKEIGKRFGYTLYETQSFLISDIENLLTKKIKISKNILRQRSKFSIYSTFPKSDTLLLGKKAKIIDSIFLRKSIIKEMKGFVASGRGKISGIVSVINDPARDRFKKGNILVAPMTRPEYLPLMRQAKAIVTDEGGITTHAAVVSRELKIPCIIGTKGASKILKNNDKIILDLSDGTINKV
ncbi:hypothetical protein C4569_03405 [Candidatus Parcubacteria bacterium]|nr:MAG: hypothetical protein C4569_03405 [Candidatus Parcubacteria bacterium]